MDISQSFQNMMDSVIAFLPRALAFLAILIIGWIVSKWVGKLIGKLLHKIGLDRAGERSGLRRFTGRFELSELLGRIIYYMLLLFTLQLAFGAFGNNPVSDLLNQLVGWLPQLFVALVIIVVAFAIANAVYGIVSGTLSETTYGNTAARIPQVAIIFFGAVAAFGQVGIATTVTTPVLWTVLAMVAGVVIVGVGGGLVIPMRERWERMLGSAESEAAKMKSTAGTGRDATSPMSQKYRSGRYGTAADTQAPAAGTMGEAGAMGGAMPEGARPHGTGAGAGLETERPMPPNEP
jgi:MFS family permease